MFKNFRPICAQQVGLFYYGENMSEITKSEKTIKQLFIGNCWSYLNDNFYKFTETNKIKIALELCKKDLPTQLEGGFNVTQMPSIKIGDKTLEPNIG